MQSGGSMHHNVVIGGGNDVNIGANAGGEINNTNENTNVNVNLNKNTNTNENTNIQGQQQGQIQGQQQGQEQSQDNDQEQTMNYYEAENKRGLTSAPVLTGVVPNTPAFNESATPTGNVQKMQNVLIFKATFTYAQLKALKGTSTHPYSERAKLRAKYFDAEKSTRVDDTATITAILAVIDKDGNVARPEGNYKPVVHLTVEGKSSTTTVSAFARIAIAAMKAGSDRVVITGEGAKRMMEAGGFGLMLGSSVMTIDEKAKSATGTASVGGFGFSKTWAGYGYCPWLQGFGVVAD
jgi:hypothetical protein